jgi:hypothetical protein
MSVLGGSVAGIGVESEGAQVSEFAGFDLDRSTARAWSRFQARLADHLFDMGDDDVLVVDTEVARRDFAGAAPYVQFARDGSTVRGEVSGNTYLAEAYELDEDDISVLTALGWQPPTLGPSGPGGEGSANFFVDLPCAEADRLAVMAVKALREVFGVAHPAFLAADGLGQDPEVPGPPAEERPPEPLAVMPESAEHLRDLVDAALTPLFESAPERDSDGDIPVPWGSSLVFVRVDEETPVVELFSVVVDAVADLERAAFEVGVLNRDLRFMKFLLVDGRVLARVHLPAWPFVPEHLRAMLTGMSAKIDELDEDLLARVGGRLPFVPPEEEGDETGARAPTTRPRTTPSDDTTLMTLLQLDADATGAVDVGLAAGVCGYDQALIVRLLGETEGQEIAWRLARDEALLVGDRAEAAACRHEMEAWERTTVLLRRALRLTVERALGRKRATGAYDLSRDEDSDRDRSARAHRQPRGARRQRPTAEEG